MTASYILKILIAVGIGAAAGAALGSTRSCETGGCPLTANPLRGSLYGGVLGLLFALAFFGGREVDPKVEAAIPRVAASSELDAHLSAAPGVAAVAFTAKWCGPCKRYKPEIARVIEEHGDKAHIAIVDVDEARSLASQYEVNQIPTTVFFREGEPFDRALGLLDAKALARRLELDGEEGP